MFMQVVDAYKSTQKEKEKLEVGSIIFAYHSFFSNLAQRFIYLCTHLALERSYYVGRMVPNV